MRTLLTAIHSKYIHSSPALFSIRAAAGDYGKSMEIAEYTINQTFDHILGSIYDHRPEILMFSCYIWNITLVRELAEAYRAIAPETLIWAGGPEVTYESERFLAENPAFDGVTIGEGEETTAELMGFFAGSGVKSLAEIAGIAYRENGEIKRTPARKPIDMNTLPFIYRNLGNWENRIIYYESSRGCPFSCAYCLSSIEKDLRFRDLSLTLSELSFFLEAGTAQVKFTDRTFNCRPDRVKAIWRHLLEKDNGVTNFHFEIAADLFDEEELEILEKARPGLIQLEIGVQSTNPETLAAIHRKADFGKIRDVVNRIRSFGNTNQHLDLIAGLPYEGYESFQNSFNDVYALRPEQLQLGFLKVLKGSDMALQTPCYGIRYRSRPPYEVLATDWLDYGEIRRLKEIEEVLELYYNSGQYVETILAAEPYFSDAFSMYESLAAYYRANALFALRFSRERRAEILLDFLAANGGNRSLFAETLTYDLYARENMKSRPSFSGQEEPDPRARRAFYEREAESPRYLAGYENYDAKQLSRMTHMESFRSAFLPDGSGIYLFDYRRRNPVNGGAAVTRVPDEEWKHEEKNTGNH